jgi:ABC-type transport system involved in multi-copper enzyme maturation permease subunit
MMQAGEERARLSAALKVAFWFAACIGLALASRWPFELRAPLAAALIAIAAVALARTATRWLGPLFPYDVVRTCRRGQPATLRIFYAALLLIMLLVVAVLQFPYQFVDLMVGRVTMKPNEMAEMAGTFFIGVITVHFLIILLVTPLYVAPAIAEEKERRSIEFLLTTELTDAEIVLGVLGARIANLILLLLTGVPIVSLIASLGGVDPPHILAAFFLIGLTVLALSSLSILTSVMSRTALRAIILTYSFTVVLFVPASCIVVPAMAMATDYVLLAIVIIYSLFQGIVATVCALWAISEMRPLALVQANPPRPRAELEQPAIPPFSRTRRLARPEAADTLPTVEIVSLADPGRPAHSTLPTVEIVSLANPDTRHYALDNSLYESSTWPSQRRPVPENALRWKELYAEQYMCPASPRLFFTCLIALGLFLALIGAPLIASQSRIYHGVGPTIEPWIRKLTIALTFILMLITALNSAGRLSRERERDTLGALLVLPITSGEIIFTKWLGGVASVRWYLWGYALIWGFGVLSGGLSPCAVPLLTAVIAVYIGLTAAIGLWLSTLTSTLRATLLTVMLTLLLAAGPGKLVQAIEGPWLFDAQRSATSWATFLDFSLTPPTVLGSLSYRVPVSDAGQWSLINHEPPPGEPPAFGQRYDGWVNGIGSYYSWRRIVYALAGFLFYLAAILALLWVANRRLIASRGAATRLATSGPRPGSIELPHEASWR